MLLAGPVSRANVPEHSEWSMLFDEARVGEKGIG
jgi:hypothetical protein